MTDAIAPTPACTSRREALALSLVDGVGPVTYRAWAAADGGADASFARRVAEKDRARALDAADTALARARTSEITLRLLGDADYPAPLLELPDPPPALWCLGDVRLLAPDVTRVAIVGTRAATTYGLRSADMLARAAADAGAVVVSGMARGIDGAAHGGALVHAGRTIAVLGSGVDVAYPRSHVALHARIAREGLVLSEALPGTPPSQGAFPRRNRIVAALARATVVVEAGQRSGALITAGLALDLGRDVAAVPGPIDVSQSAGSNALLRDGAACICEPRDLLALLGLETPTTPSDAPTIDMPVPNGLGEHERRVWEALASPAPGLDAISQRTTLGARECATAVGLLEAAGHVATSFDGSISRS